MQEGLVYVYTGDGKGKTTASVGLAVRARSRGLRVLFAQFMKEIEGGETELLETLSIPVQKFEDVKSPHFHPEVDKAVIRAEALKALKSLKAVLGDYDMVVLDEFNCLVRAGIITADEALEFVVQKPAALALVLTGRGAPEGIINHADLVTEMRNVKHPSRQGHSARPGIEY